MLLDFYFHYSQVYKKINFLTQIWLLIYGFNYRWLYYSFAWLCFWNNSYSTLLNLSFSINQPVLKNLKNSSLVLPLLLNICSICYHFIHHHQILKQLFSRIHLRFKIKSFISLIASLKSSFFCKDYFMANSLSIL